MPGRFLPADHSRGDANTIGGYAAAHARPAAFEGPDGGSYSVEIPSDRITHEGPEAFGAYFLFLRWRRMGAQGVEGHLESEYLAWGPTPDAARQALGVMPLLQVRDILYDLIAEKSDGAGGGRRWWDVMRDEGEETP
ncbi:MAG: hypothetical protein ABI877_14650 [Gemmatimonadaceae bacterium]